MTDESSQPTDPTPADPKPKKVIKIGSQRPGYVPDPPKSKQPAMPAVPTKQKPKIRMATPPSQQVAPTPAPQDTVTEQEQAVAEETEDSVTEVSD